MERCKSHMYTCKSHGNVYMQISSKSIHANLMEIDTCKSHEYVMTQISWKCIYANLMNMDTSKSDKNVHMPI